MTEHPTTAVWRALTVKSRHEKVAAQNLRGRGLEEYLPLYLSRRQWSDRVMTVEMPLFPGYVFCRVPQDQRMLALSAPGVASIVGFGGKDAVVEDHEIENVRRMLQSGIRVEPWPYVRAGQMVEIQAGPLSGMRGEVIREKGLWRLIVNVELLQRSVAAELGREMVKTIEARPAGYSAAVA